MSLKTDLKTWDLKSVADIGPIYGTHAHKAEFVDQCIELLAVGGLQRGATWLLKHHVTTKKEGLHPVQMSTLLGYASEVKHWESQLHILQIMSRVPIPIDQKLAAEQFLRGCLTETNKFVRAWAYSGFGQLAEQFPEYRTEATQILQDALENETAASVLSRVRKSLRTG